MHSHGHLGASPPDCRLETPERESYCRRNRRLGLSDPSPPVRRRAVSLKKHSDSEPRPPVRLRSAQRNTAPVGGPSLRDTTYTPAARSSAGEAAARHRQKVQSYRSRVEASSIVASSSLPPPTRVSSKPRAELLEVRTDKSHREITDDRVARLEDMAAEHERLQERLQAFLTSSKTLQEQILQSSPRFQAELLESEATRLRVTAATYLIPPRSYKTEEWGEREVWVTLPDGDKRIEIRSVRTRDSRTPSRARARLPHRECEARSPAPKRAATPAYARLLSKKEGEVRKKDGRSVSACTHRRRKRSVSAHRGGRKLGHGGKSSGQRPKSSSRRERSTRRSPAPRSPRGAARGKSRSKSRKRQRVQ